MHAAQDAPLTAEPNSAFWRQAQLTFATSDTIKNAVLGHRSEVQFALDRR